MSLDDSEVLLEHMGCPPKLWVKVASGAIKGQGQIWWRFVLFSSLDSFHTEEIA